MLPLTLLSNPIVNAAGYMNTAGHQPLALALLHGGRLHVKYIPGLIFTVLLCPLSTLIFHQPFNHGKQRYLRKICAHSKLAETITITVIITS